MVKCSFCGKKAGGSMDILGKVICANCLRKLHNRYCCLCKQNPIPEI